MEEDKFTISNTDFISSTIFSFLDTTSSPCGISKNPRIGDQVYKAQQGPLHFPTQLVDHLQLLQLILTAAN